MSNSELVEALRPVVEALRTLRVKHYIGAGGVLSKLEWYRLGEGVSERQLLDVIGVLKVQGGRLDLSYMRRWASKSRCQRPS